MVFHPFRGNYRQVSLFFLIFGLASWVSTAVAQTSITEVSEAPTQAASPKPAPLPLNDLRTFTQVFSHIRTAYVKEVTDQQLLEYAVKGMLAELDPHSTYLDASSYDDLRVSTHGEFGGLGIEVGMENGYIKVISPIDDTPAKKAGIQAGDLIIQLDGKPVKGMSLNEAIKEMRGEVGSTIDISLVRKGTNQPIDMAIKRDVITVRSVRSDILEPGYGYLRIAQFQAKTGQDVVKELRKLKDKDPALKGLVLDLRNNPGGVLQASVEVADAFLEEGLVVYTEGRVKNVDLSYDATPGDETNGLPIVVLINEGSASASEIVAGALQDHSRAVILGTRSFGKGSVQTVIPIDEERAIKLTTALYFTPKGRSIQAEGIEPDVSIERATITALQKRERISEAKLANHLGNGNKKSAKPKPSDADSENAADSNNDSKENVAQSDDKAERIMRDNQLYEALNLLKGLHVFSRYDGTPNEIPASTLAQQDTEAPAES